MAEITETHVEREQRAGQGRELAPARADRGRLPAAPRRAARRERRRPAHVRRPAPAGLHAAHGGRDPPVGRSGRALDVDRCSGLKHVGTRGRLRCRGEGRGDVPRRPQGLQRLRVQRGDRDLPAPASRALGRGRGDRAAPQRRVGVRLLHAQGPGERACLSATMPRRRFDALELELADGERCSSRARPRSTRRRASSASAPRRSSGSGSATISPRSSASSACSPPRACSRPSGSAPLPRFPRAVGVVTGADAAARGDVVTGHPARGSRRRTSSSPRRACRARAPAGGNRRRAAARRSAPAVDVVIVARGGGSFEDLLPFSDEAVVRAFAACPVPVVSAVGHEQDTPLCDLAADVRASTPTAAARARRARPRRAAGGARTPARALLDGSVRRALARDRERLDRSRDRLRAAPVLLLERRRVALDHAAARLQALSPRATLTRGYAIVRSGGAALRDASAQPLRRARSRSSSRAASLTATVEEVQP